MNLAKGKLVSAIVVLLALCLLFVASVATTTYAYWTSSNSDTDPKGFSISDDDNPNLTNPSAKYQVFSGYSVTNTATEAVTHYASLTAYNGLVAEVTILSETTITLADSTTATATVSTIDTVALQNNRVVTILIIPASVTHIVGNAFANMTNLQTVRFLGNVNDITFDSGSYPFIGCEKLTTVYDSRGVSYASTCVANIKTASSSNAFLDTPLA